MTDYTKLVEALRYCVNARNCKKCGYRLNNNSVKCRIQRVEDAAAEIEALQAQLPKRGEWIIHGEPPMLVIECSVCGQKYFNHVMQEKAKYCSMCGAKMTEVLE